MIWPPPATVDLGLDAVVEVECPEADDLERKLALLLEPDAGRRRARRGARRARGRPCSRRAAGRASGARPQPPRRLGPPPTSREPSVAAVLARSRPPFPTSAVCCRRLKPLWRIVFGEEAGDVRELLHCRQNFRAAHVPSVAAAGSTAAFVSSPPPSAVAEVAVSRSAGM